MPTTYDQLVAEHHAILAAADRLLAALHRVPRVSMEELSRLRTEVSMLLRDHLAAEEREIFGRLAALPAAERPAIAAEVMREIRDARSRYSDHVRDWHTRTIEKDWSGYIIAATHLNAALKRLARREEQELYRPALALLDAPRPRAA